MDISDLDNLEQSVERLLAQAREDLEKEKLRQQRERQIQEFVEQIESRLQPLLTKVEAALATLDASGMDNPKTRQQLEEKAAEIRQELAEAPAKAQEHAEKQFLLQEDRLVEEREAQEVERWRHQLKADLLEMIAEQTDFYSATDAAIAIKGHVSDLKAVGGLEEVVEALMHQINTNSETEGPVARLRGSHEQTLTFIYNKALENRSRVDRPPNVQPATRHRKSERKPSLYTDLEGKVLVFGGHDRLESAVRNRLRDSTVYLVWATEQGGLQLAAQAESQIPSADLVLIVTGYASHSLTERAIESCKRCGQPYEIINTTGMTRLLEAIESGLKARQLAKRWKG
ncbi:MAG: DUF2325 domain-containing protein [Oscillatoriales cyanobacterium SM2_1_8]|nr:DUF2325 domain-containing protein [Oscillatoriales cyanobacterium SM2_1_8]